MEIAILVFIGLCFAGLWATGSFKEFGKSASAKRRDSDGPVYDWPTIGDFDFEVVGEANYQAALKRMAGSHGFDSANVEKVALIVPEGNNKHDKLAVRVDIDGETVGYLSRDDARSFRRRLASKKIGVQPTTCGALICGGFRSRNGQVASYGVKLDIKPFSH